MMICGGDSMAFEDRGSLSNILVLFCFYYQCSWTPENNLLHLVTMKTCRYLLSEANSYENND